MRPPGSGPTATVALAVPVILLLAACGPALVGEPESATGGQRGLVRVEDVPDSGTEERLAANAALDAYLEAERSQVAPFLEANRDLYSDITISGVYPDMVIFEYSYAAPVDGNEARAHFDSMIPMLQTLCDDRVFPAMAAAGVTGQLKARYTYYNADGSPMWQKTFEPS